jgi:3-carboxy-cis,cis-muconate cycloisomerase
VLDSAAMLVAREAVTLVLGFVDAAAGTCAALGREHRSTPMAARTLLQQAVPTTFGLVAAGWLVALLDARERLAGLIESGLALQLGGAGGTLSALRDDGTRVTEELARELDLAVPTLPWHTNRVRVAELGAALATLAGVCGKIGLDVVLLSQTEVGEVREQAGGGSSAMPQKRNPVRATLARACAPLACAQAAVLQESLVQEHQRAAGAWHAEWEALCGALAHAGGAAAAIAESLGGLEVDAERMRANLDASGGLVLSERVAVALADRVGRSEAHELVAEAVGAPAFREALLADPRAALSAEELDALLDPTTYLGSAGLFVDRALARYETESARREGGT